MAPTKSNTTKTQDPLVAVLGVTGAGKSSFLRLLSDDPDCLVGESLDSETSEVRLVTYSGPNGRLVRLADTPGFDDSREDVTDTDLLKQLAEFLKAEFKSGTHLTGMIYMHRITDVRVGGTVKRNFRMFDKFCGAEALKNAVIVTTRWDCIDPVVGEKREKELREKDGFFKQLLDGGATMMRHYNTQDSARAILARLIDNDPIDPDFVKEVNKDVPIGATGAGSVVGEGLEAFVQKHQKEMKELREDIASAMETQNEKLRKDLEKERMELWDKIKRLEAEKLKLSEAPPTTPPPKPVGIKVSLNGFRFTASDNYNDSINALVAASIVNTSSSVVEFSGDIAVYYRLTKIGRVLLERVNLQSGNNDFRALQWKFEPAHYANADVQKFFAAYFATKEFLPLSLHVDGPKLICGDPSKSPRLVLESGIEGIASKLIRNVKISLGLGVIFKSVSFQFEFDNPLEAPLTLREFELYVNIRGTRIAFVRFANNFTMPTKGPKWSAKADAQLTNDYATSILRGLNPSSTLDIEVVTAKIVIGDYEIDNLKFNFSNVRYTVGLF
ncbi:hypothetical protein GALMADRAFT_272969 [Galerina marginata CBS 339.88]|uniref:G domain-containing protein n=1 Tax=Galerina marginata (strain CBS 339.88) TaxID=685588 RepID=A0A067SAJ3_GALM3|nr:hypothetical protein GALMADRAFT_272969 [Galerina marginata CBS 339.88]